MVGVDAEIERANVAKARMNSPAPVSNKIASAACATRSTVRVRDFCTDPSREPDLSADVRSGRLDCNAGTSDVTMPVTSATHPVNSSTCPFTAPPDHAPSPIIQRRTNCDPTAVIASAPSAPMNARINPSTSS